MKKLFSRILISAIAVTMMVTVLAGCQKSEKPEPVTPSIEPVVTEPADEQKITDEIPTDTLEDEGNTSDFAGTTITLNNNEQILCECGRIEYMDFGADIPSDWIGKVYIVTYDTGVAFYQKASWDAYEGMGYIVSLDRTDNMVGEFAGEVNWAFTPDFMYYYDTPTDVPYDYENEESTEEYGILAEGMEFLLRSWEIYEQDIQYNVKEYVCPMSNYKPIPEEITMNISKEELLMAHNEIYARHGKTFANPYTQWHFDSCSWYSPSQDEVTDDMLTDVEKENIEIIKNAIVNLNVNYPYPEQIAVGSVCQKEINLEWGIVDVGYSVEGSYETGFDAVLTLSDKSFGLKDDFGIELESPEESFFYITDINPYIDGLEIAVIDYGMDDNTGAYFFTQESDGSVVSIGYVPGCSFPGMDNMPCDSFTLDGRVISINRTYILGNNSYYVSLWYDGENHTFESATYGAGMYEMVPSAGKVAKQDMSGFVSEKTNELFPIQKGETYYFLETNDVDLIKLRNKFGDVGFLSVTDEMSVNPEAYFE